MPHHVGSRRWGAARSVTAFALLVAFGCSGDDASVVVIVADPSARAVLVAPIDPRGVRAAMAPRSATPAMAASIARYYAASDSADSLDAAFESARDSLDREARVLAPGDRHSAEYARRFDAYMARVTVARRTREARDRARRRAAALRAQLGPHAPDPTRRHDDPSARARAALDSASQPTGRPVIRRGLNDGHATLDMDPGVWWFAAERADGRLGGIRRHEVRPGARDTVRIGG